MVEGKGFVDCALNLPATLAHDLVNRGNPCHPVPVLRSRSEGFGWEAGV